MSHVNIKCASLVGHTIECFDFYSYATAAVLVFPHLFFPMGEGLHLTACVVFGSDAPLSRAAEAVRAEMLPFISRYIDEKQPPGLRALPGVRAIAADE